MHWLKNKKASSAVPLSTLLWTAVLWVCREHCGEPEQRGATWRTAKGNWGDYSCTCLRHTLRDGCCEGRLKCLQFDMVEKSELRNAILWSNSDTNFTLWFLQRSILGGASFQEGEDQGCHVDSDPGTPELCSYILWPRGDSGWVWCGMYSGLGSNRMKALGIRKA